MDELLPTRIDELLAKYLAQEASSAEQIEVEAWIESAPENRAYFDSLTQVWDQTAKADPTDLAAIDAGWASLQDRIGQAAPSSDKVISMRRPLWQVAAAVVALLVIGISLWRLLPRESTDIQPNFVVYAATDSMQAITLVDGSTIQLNPGSQMTVPEAFSPSQREVSLEGTAFFEVTSDATHPFTIQTELGTVQVLGTQFEVKTDEQSLEVKVEEGLVEVAIPDVATLQLTARQGISYRMSDSVAPTVDPLAANALSAYTLSFSFEDQPLSTVVATLQQAYGVEILLGSPSIQHCLVNSPFEQASLEYILKVLSGMHTLTWEKQGSVYVLTGEGCTK